MKIHVLPLSRLADLDMTPADRRDELDVSEPVVLCRDLPTDAAPSQSN